MTDPPQVRNNSARTVTLSHREYLCDIVSGPAGSFSVQNFVINPGNTVTFPWLSGVASKFQQYRLDGMIFQFKSMSADALNSTNTALGQVIMATNYDVNQPLFDSKYEMENTEFSTSVKPSLSAMHPIECARTESTLNELYVAAGGNIPPGGTASMYNFGNFQIATNGFQAANVNIGELWVTYEVTLFKPIQTSINETGNLWAVDLYRPQFTTTAAVVTGPFCIPNTDIANYQQYVPQIRAGTVPTLDITVRPTGSYNQFELRPKGATIFPEGTLFMFVTSATINVVPPDPAWIGTASWNVDVTAAESNLQQVVGVFNFPAQTRFGTTNNGLQDAAAITIARVKYAPAYTGKPLVFTVNGSAPRSTGPSFTFEVTPLKYSKSLKICMMKLHKFNLLNNKLPSVVFIFDQSTVYNSYPRIYTSFAVSACSLAAFFASLSCLSKSSSLALAWYHKSYMSTSRDTVVYPSSWLRVVKCCLSMFRWD